MEESNKTNDLKIVCFAGAEYDLPSWTNRQHIMSRVSKKYPVLYVEPRVWFLSYIWRNKTNPKKLLRWFKKTFWWEKRNDNLYIKGQWNLIPGSREIKVVSIFNHMLNRWCILQTAWWLGFRKGKQCMWIYDTEAAEFLSAFKKAKIIYDCVDDHAAQEGVNRNAKRVNAEEQKIQEYADLITVTSKHLYSMKKHVGNVHLVLNAGDVDLYKSPPKESALNNASKIMEIIPKPIIGTVGALDDYKVNFDLLFKTAKKRPGWQFVFIGSRVVSKSNAAIEKLKELDNIHFIGAVDRNEVPAYVRYFDICLIPYNYNRYNKSSFPLKFWEFMATGKPLIVSGLPELKEYRNLIGYVKGIKDFIATAEAQLSDLSKGERDRKTLARKHGWNQRANTLISLVLTEFSDNN